MYWDICEMHLSEAAFLWHQWERALAASHYVLQDVVAGPEERLRAHLDALVVGGRVLADRLLVKGLQNPDVGIVFASAWSLLHAEEGDFDLAVFEAMKSASSQAKPVLGRALEVSSREDLTGRLLGEWKGGDAALRAALMPTLAARNVPELGDCMKTALGQADPQLRAAALRVLRWEPDGMFSRFVRESLSSHHGVEWQEAAVTAYAFEVPEVFEVCRHRCTEAPSAGRCAWGILGLSPHPEDRAFLAKASALEAKGADAIWALGFSGHPESANHLVRCLGKSAFVRSVGEAFSAITGLVLTAEQSLSGPEQLSPGPEIGPDDPPPDVQPESFCARPNPSALAAWWDEKRSAFDERVRYAYGHPLEHVPDAGVVMGRRALFRLLRQVECRLQTDADVGKGWSLAHRGSLPTAAT